MENREILFEKIEAKEKEWEEQVKRFQSKTAHFDVETRMKFDIQINNLNAKLKEIEQKTNELKKTSSEVAPDIGDKIIHSWIESLTTIDNAISTLKRYFN